MNPWSAVAGGVVGAAILLSGLRVAQELGWTRIDLPLILGTAFSENRSRASAIGYVLHFVNGVLFALGYYAVFAAVGDPAGCSACFSASCNGRSSAARS